MIKYFKNDIESNPGNPIHIIYAPVVDEKGNIELVEKGIENTDDIINSYQDSCDINLIIARVEAGDLSALNANKGTYGDFTNLPKTYAEVLQLQINSKRVYDDLPIDVKQKFNNDFNNFLATTGTDEWYEKMKDILPIIDDKVVEKVEEVEKE